MKPQERSSLAGLAPYVPGKAKAAGFDNPLKLSANENPLGCSPAARAAYLAASGEIHLYPDAQTSRLRAAVAERFELEPERLVFGAGSDEIFAMAAQAYLADGCNIVQPRYAFAAWAIAARAAGGEVKSAPENDFAVDVDAMMAAVDEQTRLVFIANPANPTGTWIPFSEVERLHTGLPEHVLLVLDGAYAECAGSVEGFSDGLAWARDKQNVLVTRTFSKVYGLASLRIGWGYAPPAVAEVLNRIRLPFSVPRAGEAAAVAALADEAFTRRSVQRVEEGRAALAEALRGFGLRTLPTATNFVTVGFAGEKVSAGAMEAALAKRGILVRALGGYGLADWLRISVGDLEGQERVIAAIGAILCDGA